MIPKSDCHTHHRNSGLRFSLMLIIVGGVFLAINTGILPTMYQPLFSSWPIWLVFGGLYFLINFSWFMGLILFGVGTFFLVPQIGQINPDLNIPANFTHIYWPAMLVFAGVYFFIARLFKPNCHRHFHQHFEQCNSTVSEENGYLHVSSAFDSRKSIVVDPVFQGGDVECSFGEVIVDLRKTNLPEGQVVLNINVSFGSVVVIVPSNWNVKLMGNSAFGSFVDARIAPAYNPDTASTLVVQGKCSFGECKLRD